MSFGFRSANSRVEGLSKSQIYLDYQRAFAPGTRLPVLRFRQSFDSSVLDFVIGVYKRGVIPRI